MHHSIFCNIRYAVDAVKDGGCECVIMNTVADAICVYDKIKKSKKNDCKIVLYHSRMTINARYETSREILSLSFNIGSSSHEIFLSGIYWCDTCSCTIPSFVTYDITGYPLCNSISPSPSTPSKSFFVDIGNVR